MENEFEIATEDGSMFCKCSNEDGRPVFITKNGRQLSIDSLVKQAYNPDIARKMRKRAGKRPSGQSV